jgi:hypothetical protein
LVYIFVYGYKNEEITIAENLGIHCGGIKLKWDESICVSDSGMSLANYISEF